MKGELGTYLEFLLMEPLDFEWGDEEELEGLTGLRGELKLDDRISDNSTIIKMSKINKPKF